MNLTDTKQFAAESAHWYRTDGTPAYTVIGANGKERNTTLRDARKHNLYPSVTGIIRMAAAPGLEQWKRRQLALACLTLPRIEGESEDAFLARAEIDAAEQAKKAAARGEEIHEAIETWYRGTLRAADTPFEPWVRAAHFALIESCERQQWEPEKAFASPLGFGGKRDLQSRAWCVDIKTKDGPLDDLKTWDDHAMQLGAYRQPLLVTDPEIRGGILFVRRDAPEARFVELPREEIDRGWTMFAALLDYWQAKTGYRPTP